MYDRRCELCPDLGGEGIAPAAGFTTRPDPAETIPDLLAAILRQDKITDARKQSNPIRQSEKSLSANPKEEGTWPACVRADSQQNSENPGGRILE